jgi:hypothetical protein
MIGGNSKKNRTGSNGNDRSAHCLKPSPHHSDGDLV